VLPSSISKLQIEQSFPSMTVTIRDGLTCVVCLAAIEEDQECRTLQCNHIFHTECIDSWWLHKPRNVLECPLCKRFQRLVQQQAVSAGPKPEAVGAITTFAV